MCKKSGEQSERDWVSEREREWKKKKISFDINFPSLRECVTSTIRIFPAIFSQYIWMCINWVSLLILASEKKRKIKPFTHLSGHTRDIDGNDLVEQKEKKRRETSRSWNCELRHLSVTKKTSVNGQVTEAKLRRKVQLQLTCSSLKASTQQINEQTHGEREKKERKAENWEKKKISTGWRAFG